MASSLPLASTDPDDLAAIIRPVGGDVVVTARGTFRSQAVRLNFNRLWMQDVQEDLPRIWHSAAPSTRAAIWFLTQPGPAIVFQGAEVRTREIGICPIGQPIWQRLTGRSSWGSVSL
jgi:hypothetical protein